jgi:beta-lactamase class D
MRHVFFLAYLILSANLSAQDNLKETYIGLLDLDSLYSPFSGSFVLLDLNKGNSYFVYNDSISSERYSPCSTFKITNSLIGIESGVAENENYLIKFDSIKTPPKPWWFTMEPFKHWMQDHTMESAIKYSVVWYYQELARRIGEEKMKSLLHQIDYGNNDISSGIDNFWLCGSLKISAWEQVEFLKKLYTDQFSGFSGTTQETVKEIMLCESAGKFKLYGKTGGGGCLDNKVIGWYVGFLETEYNTYIFAMNMFVNEYGDFDNNKRIEFTKDILKGLKLME